MSGVEYSRQNGWLEGPSRFRRFCRFGAVGLIGIAVQLASLYGLIIFGFHYFPSTLLAVELAILHNFIWHQQWTWRDRGGHSALTSFALFNVTNGGVSLVGNALLMPVLVSISGFGVLTSNVLAIAACSLVNFAIADILVFRKKPPRASLSRA